MHAASGSRPEGEDFGAALGHLVVAALLGIAAPPVTAGEPLPTALLQRLGAIGIHAGPLLTIGRPAQFAARLGPLQVGTHHGDELIEIHAVYPACHHIRNILAPYLVILTRQAKDEIRHYHGSIIPGQFGQPGQQGLPVIEAGRLLAHPGFKTLYPEREAVEAPRQRCLPLGIIKTVEAPFQGHLGIQGQWKALNRPAQSG